MSKSPIVSTIKKVMPSVVSIAISKHLEDLEKEIPQDVYPLLPKDKSGKHLQVPDALVDARGMVQIGGGSGFVVDSDSSKTSGASGALILTNKHVISDPKAEYTVILNDDRRFPAKILSRDPINDVAILKIEINPSTSSGNTTDGSGLPRRFAPRNDSEKLPAVKLGDAAKLELGEQVIAIGNALGIFKNTVSVGIISGLSRAISAQAEPDAPPQEMRGLIQTDAAINVGNSGGPLVNLHGEAIGVNAAIVFGAQNIGFAIPINAARRDLADIKKYGRIKRPYLGVRYMMIDENMKEKMKLPVDYGALVIGEDEHGRGIVGGGPADKAGIKEKDVILTLNGNKLDKDHPIQDFLENMNVGENVDAVVLRSGKEMKVKMALAERI